MVFYLITFHLVCRTVSPVFASIFLSTKNGEKLRDIYISKVWSILSEVGFDEHHWVIFYSIYPDHFNKTEVRESLGIADALISSIIHVKNSRFLAAVNRARLADYNLHWRSCRLFRRVAWKATDLDRVCKLFSFDEIGTRWFAQLFSFPRIVP